MHEHIPVDNYNIVFMHLLIAMFQHNDVFLSIIGCIVIDVSLSSYHFYRYLLNFHL